jgi:TfoX/Sxy family transcriptional regulator of competence genes
LNRPGPEFEQFVVDQLEAVPGLSASPFFGGIGLRSGGTFFGVIFDGALYFTTTDETRAEYERLGSRRFSYRKRGRMQETKLFEVPASVLDDPGALSVFAELAIEGARRRPPSGGRGKRRVTGA